MIFMLAPFFNGVSFLYRLRCSERDFVRGDISHRYIRPKGWGGTSARGDAAFVLCEHCSPRHWGMVKEEEPYCVKAPPPCTSPSFARPTLGAASMFGYSAPPALPLRYYGVVRLAVDSLVSVSTRWMLSHEVVINSAANPTGRILD